ncbi:D-beta-hydroxybutyrate dehydrogenase, mitochondrial-like [Hyposmocoma kahamanoa]|uniref:D-beta-hydroxybutyrate dehydrogenase, mitochondrial-like n=1 Tax=Hyposmocoma kahamanoa TaxID=1477025 RepID=UPI000E6D65C8|nr:D-beta-hydroxybutyrate dehydrogenase, mitochondrial-like [Hyposmocoma kahamanoa]
MLRRVVVITGCDSGLGWAVAARSAREGLVTVAGMYGGTESRAAKALNGLSAHTHGLDVTKPESVTEFKDYIDTLVKDNPGYKLHAVVNNAGIMTIGDYEWQTQSIIENTINVNLLGAMRVASAFLPELRRIAIDKQDKLRPRIINIASHCGLQPLPGFGPYSASKAAVLAWTKALRLEHYHHGLTAVAFVPGGFVTNSNLLSSQKQQSLAMLENLDEEQKKFYGKRLKTLTDYLALVSQNTSYDSLKDESIIETYMKALLDENPKELYKVESGRYNLYYNLLKIPMPESFQQWLINKFLSFPKKQ